VTPRLKRGLLIATVMVVGVGWLVWNALAYLRYCASPPWELMLAFYVLYLSLVFYTIHVGRKVPIG
jgi:hypothetical protein